MKKEEMKKKRKIEMTAIHEAGHAVMCFVFRIGFNYVSIVPDEDWLGVVRHPKGVYGKNFDPDLSLPPVTIDKIERHARVYFAGQIAEEMFFGKLSRSDREHSSHDNYRAVNLASYVAGGGKVLQKYMDYLYASAEQWLSNPMHRYAIKVLADELLMQKKIGSKKAREIIKKAFNAFYEKRNDATFKKKWKWLELK
jgi:hypothetical protein